MKNLTTTLTFFLIALLILSSCDSKKPVIKDLPEDKIETTYNVKLPDLLTIELASNPSTGYKWVLSNKIKPAVVAEKDRKFVKDETTIDLVGAGGKDIWTFTSEKPGETYLYFVYKRDDGKVDKEKYFKVIVME
jgi:inhibitor of cysteine peptidase